MAGQFCRHFYMLSMYFHYLLMIRTYIPITNTSGIRIKLFRFN